MSWYAEHGEHLETYYRVQAQGLKVAALDIRPELISGFGTMSDNPYLRAYYLLSKSRQIGMAEFYIPLTEIVAYLDLIGIEGHEARSDFATIIIAIDAGMLEFKAKLQKRQEESTKKFQPKS